MIIRTYDDNTISVDVMSKSMKNFIHKHSDIKKLQALEYLKLIYPRHDASNLNLYDKLCQCHEKKY